ncbi:MAG: LytTR family DNA-binding domain-containing protein [Woeseiaceae bacterium]|nr:LytTR family DNA-binding domain-containing protein [Woeseiaceae bacterium]
MSRHADWSPNLASPRNLRFGALVLLLIMVNQINDPLVDPTLGEALVFWGVRTFVLICGLWLADRLVSRYLAERLATPEWLKPVVLVSAIGILPLALTEALLELQLPFRPEFLDDELWAVSPVLAVLGEWVTLASIVIPIHLVLWLIIDRNTHKTSEPNLAVAQSTPEFLQRTANLRAEDVLALQAEEHYVRIYSSEGSELIHCRFGKAANEMPAELGLQVHRSWWVADSAVRSAQRGSRRWQLNLVTDVAVPVSDSYVSAVRERGWLKRKVRK